VSDDHLDSFTNHSPELHDERFLTQVDLAKRWLIKERTIEGWRRRGTGPAFIRIERRVRYRLTDIEVYEAAGRNGRSSRSPRVP